MTLGPRDRVEVIDLVLSFRRLVQGEIDLALAEIRQNARMMVIGAIMVAVALLLVIVALNLLAETLVLAVVLAGVPIFWAPVVVAVILLVLAAILALWGFSRFRPSRLVPVRAAARLRRDAETLKEMMKHDTQT